MCGARCGFVWCGMVRCVMCEFEREGETDKKGSAQGSGVLDVQPFLGYRDTDLDLGVEARGGPRPHLYGKGHRFSLKP